jgi:hypothetical protein
MGELVQFPRKPLREIPLSKIALANHLGYTTRWVELRMKEGMPSTLHGKRRRFLLSEVLAWLDERKRDGVSER